MINFCISNNDFVGTTWANNYFSNIQYGQFRNTPDNTLLGTLRALSINRIPRDEQCHISVMSSDDSYTSGIVDSAAFIEPKTLIVVCNCDSIERTSAMLNASSKWNVIDKVQAFFRGQFEIVGAINDDTQTALMVVAANYGEQWNGAFHALQAAIPTMLPWYFEGRPLSEVEERLLKSLGDNSGSLNWHNISTEIFEGTELRNLRLKAGMDEFIKNGRDVEIQNLTTRIESYRRDARSYRERIEHCLYEIEKANMRLIGIREYTKQKEEDNGLLDYLQHNANRIYVKTITNEGIWLSINGTMDFYDEDMALRIMNNYDSCLYNDLCGDVSYDDMYDMYHAIFIDKRFTLKTCAAYYVGRFSVDALGGTCYYPFNNDHLPNPHIYEYSCLGNYNTLMYDALEKGDYIGAIELCAASCSSLNFSDSVVMTYFSRELEGNISNGTGGIRILIDNTTGEEITAYEGLQRVIGEEN